MNKINIFSYTYSLFIYLCIDYMYEKYVIVLKIYILKKLTNFNMENKMYLHQD